MNIYLIRLESTLGAFISHDHGLICYVMEPPWRDNRANVSCIPVGDYDVTYLPRSASGKYKDCYHVHNVPERFAILIHKGNTVRDTMGCMLPGVRVGMLGKQRAVMGSAQAMRKLHKLTKRKGFKLHVRNLITTR